MKIRLEYPEMEALSNQLHSQEETFQQCVAELNRLIHSVPDSWEGKSADAYINQFEELQPAFEQTQVIIEALQQQIKETMAVMKEKDSSLASKLHF
ncbi:WXG100 family type VII secretion target [Enterococcus sp. BWM-S5]|uniref:ESAT-6-like protein n=1 Tax=Enterococcus larvae TaxID=2794352 RepID=A0ABS4CGL9_9ENTE|nr:WXG100 family type VII secretion target [Enterococcus larvae]MBP1045589.1 WXG100 family type VII secretion target [Enterococcus larvae]